LWGYNSNFQAVVHSHINYPHLSKDDMSRQRAMNIAWGVAFINDNKKDGIHFWGGDTEVQDLEERPFIHGLYDCYSLISDFYNSILNIELPIIARENLWWSNGNNLFEDHFVNAGFSEVNDKDDFKIGDVYLFKIKGDVVNHCAVNVGNGTMLHHLQGRLSNYTNMFPWIRKAKVVRKND
jgi:cell wall-associated NlpC family hydrolase